GITEPPDEMFGKVMSISDELMWRWFELLSFRPMSEIQALREQCAQGRNPRDVKVLLAQEIVERFHSRVDAERAAAAFDARFRLGAAPADMPEVVLHESPVSIVQVLKRAGLVPSTSEANRSIEQGGVRVDGERVSDRTLALSPGTYVVQIGKRRFARVRVEAPR
ncbi:MAG TPA: S4 domain-containing protein, partial [Zeimonas sp.]|nr:S4 domain-containing protein [Zeimonas sp.]